MLDILVNSEIYGNHTWINRPKRISMQIVTISSRPPSSIVMKDNGTTLDLFSSD